MKRYYFILVLSILSALQSYAQVETHYYQEGDTTNVLPDYIFHKQNGITIKMPALKSQGQVFDSFEDQSPAPPIFPWIFFLDGK